MSTLSTHAIDIPAILRGRAQQLGLQAEDDESLLEAVLQHDIQSPEPDETACRRYYEQHADALREGEIVEADHILFAVTPSTPIDALRAKAEQSLTSLLAAPQEFADKARALSNCPSAEVGGNLGQLTREQCVPEFWQALIAHGKPGMLPRLVRTRFGLHIVRIGRIAHGHLPDYEVIRTRIAETLSREAQIQAMQIYAESLLQQYAGIDPTRSSA